MTPKLDLLDNQAIVVSPSQLETVRKCRPKLLDLSGQTFGHWEVIERVGIGKWLCWCDCGNERVVKQSHLFSGRSKSCGCYRSAVTRARMRTHGLSKTREYHIWLGIHHRCKNPRSSCYHNYGGRGITVAPEWDNFEQFYMDMGPRPPKHEIERKDNDKGYCKDNCLWVTHKDNANNKRTCHFIEWNGQRLSCTQAARLIGMKPLTLVNRLRLGWSVEKAMTQPLRPWHKH